MERLGKPCRRVHVRRRGLLHVDVRADAKSGPVRQLDEVRVALLRARTHSAKNL